MYLQWYDKKYAIILGQNMPLFWDNRKYAIISGQNMLLFWDKICHYTETPCITITEDKDRNP